jgi:hypothetical protein
LAKLIHGFRIIDNESFGVNIYKIGWTAENLVRIDMLNKRGYAGIFNGFYFAHKSFCLNAELGEHILHNIFSSMRIDSQLELFNVKFDTLRDTVINVCKSINNNTQETKYKLNITTEFTRTGSKILGKNDFLDQITFNLDGCYIFASKIRTEIKQINSSEYRITTNSREDCLQAINNIAIEKGLKPQVILKKCKFYLKKTRNLPA